MLMDGLNFVVKKFLGYSFQVPKLVIIDHSAGFLAGLTRYDANAKFATCWPHIMQKLNKGTYLPKTHPDFPKMMADVQV